MFLIFLHKRGWKNGCRRLAKAAAANRIKQIGK
jgi:hypothetical protein